MNDDPGPQGADSQNPVSAAPGSGSPATAHPFSEGSKKWDLGTQRPMRSDLLLGAWEWLSKRAAVMPGSRRARRFARFGRGSIWCFPPTAMFGESGIQLGEDTLIGPYVSISAGMAPTQDLLSDEIVVIGDRCLIGRQSSIVGHFSIVIEDDVFFGPNVYVTDQNHAVDDLSMPIGKQSMTEQPVRIGAGSWLGANVVVLPGVTIGKHVAVGAGSIVTKDLPDNCVAVGSPARVLKQL